MLPVQPLPPGPGQESVWDYPRPPRIEPTARRIRVLFAGIVIADSTRALRLLETSHPPNYYIPTTDIRMEYLAVTPRHSFCEFKGTASYYTIQVGERRVEDAAWFYPRPTAEFVALAGYVAFYPGRMDACYVDDEQVTPQAGEYYGGWITSDVVGPFKGAPNTRGW